MKWYKDRNNNIRADGCGEGDIRVYSTISIVSILNEYEKSNALLMERLEDMRNMAFRAIVEGWTEEQISEVLWPIPEGEN